MIEKMNIIRKPEHLSAARNIFYSIFIFAAGIVLGTLSKILDETPSNVFPTFIEAMDLRNFFSRMGVWMFIGICIAIYSKTPLRAAINNVLFFIGMVSSYYIYTVTVAGFFPKSYMMIWIAMTIISPFLAFVCWYARGTHNVCIGISSIIFMMMTRQAFHFGFWYFDISYILELLLWIGTILVLYRKPKQITMVIGIGTIIFILTSQLNLFWGMM